MASFVIKFYYQMGNKQSKSYKPASFKRQSWHVVQNPKRSFHVQHGLYYIYRNNLTSEEVEEYQIFFHNQAEYQKYLEFFEWRERQDTVVNTKFINAQETKQFCTSNHNARVYIERIPVRLSDIHDIPFPENLYVLFSALDGFEKLFHFVGYFRPAEDFICIDRDGRVKVWLNSDLSKCHTIGSHFSDEAVSYNDSLQYQEEMVSEIIEMVEKNTAEEIEANMTFTQHLRMIYKDRKIGFKQAKQEIIAYARKNEVEIPNYFESVMGMFIEEKPSEIEERDGHNEISQRARNEEDRIIKENRQLNKHLLSERQREMRDRGIPMESDHSINNVQESVIYNSAHGQPLISKAHSYQKFQSENEVRPASYTLPTFSGSFNPSNTQLQATRTTSPMIPLANRSNQNFQVKFNYKSVGIGQPVFVNQPQPLAPIPLANLANIPQQQTVARPVYRPFETIQQVQQVQHQQFQHQQVQQVQQLQAIQPVHFVQAKPTPIQLQTSESEQGGRGATRDSVKSMVVNNKVVYSDTSQTYELDQEIVKDIIKYFG